MTETAKRFGCGCGGVSIQNVEAGGATNQNCHGFTGGVQRGAGRRLRVPRVVLVCWDNFFVSTPGALTSAKQLVTDLVTGPFMNGLVQYGISRGSLINTITLDTAVFPAPATWDSFGSADQTQVLAFLNNGNVFPKPAVNEGSLVFLFLLPTTTALTNGTTNGVTNVNVCGWHHAAKLNSNSTDDDLFWAVVRTDKAPTTSAHDFMNNVAQCVGHELAEAFTDRDSGGYVANVGGVGCEIGDICELNTFTYRIWTVEQYWSNWDSSCINGDKPVSVRQYLAARKLNPAAGLRSLHTAAISTDWMASTL